MFDKEISHYKVVVEDMFYDDRTTMRTSTYKKDTEEDAVKFAREVIKKHPNHKVKIEQICHLIGWWDEE